MLAPEAQNERNQLVAAGFKLLAAASHATELNAETVSAAAALPLAAFQRCFPEADDYPLALFQQLLDEARTAATQAATGNTGVMSLKRGIEAYLDTHLRHPALRELTLALRHSEAGQAIVLRRVAGFHRVLQIGLSAMTSLHPLAGAQLLTALVVETATAEYEARRPLPEMRETLYAYLDRLVP